MLPFSRRAVASASARAFSTTSSRSADMAKLTLIGRLGRDPELRYTKNNKEYMAYTIATKNHGPPLPDGVSPSTTWHNVVCFSPSGINFLRNVKKGSLVYAEAGFELRQADPNAHSESPEGQRQIFLRHENMRVLRQPITREEPEESENED